MTYNGKTTSNVTKKQFIIGMVTAGMLATGVAVPAVGALTNGSNERTEQSTSDARGTLEANAVGGADLQGSTQEVQNEGDESNTNLDGAADVNVDGNLQAANSSDDESDSTQSNTSADAGLNAGAQLQSSSTTNENDENDEESSSSSTDLQTGLNLGLGLSSSSENSDDGSLNISL